MQPYFIGIDLGGTRVKMGIVRDAKVVYEDILPAQSSGTLEAFLPSLYTAIQSIISKAGVPPADLRGIGMTFPGIVDPFQKKILQTNHKYQQADAVNLTQWVADNWQVPFYIDNDAHMAAIGEWQYGAGKDCQDMVLVTLGTGIGSSAIINGRLLRGAHFMAGCLGGHFTINYQGDQCICGNTGCSEMYAAGWSLPVRIKNHRQFNNNDSLLHAYENPDFRQLFDCADQGDAFAQQIKEECLEVWATTIVNLVHAYDPAKVILGGGVVKSKGHIIPPIRQKVANRVWRYWGDVNIDASLLDDQAAILGIVYQLQQIL